MTLDRSIFVCIVLSGLVGFAWAGEMPKTKSPQLPIRGILYNEDDSHRFAFDDDGSMKRERLERLVDDLAGSQVSVMLICCCAQNAIYDSKVWDRQGEGFDPAKDNNQPFFGDVPKAVRPSLRIWSHNAKNLRASGVDPIQPMIDRCREKGISPWISMRMNDIHDAELLKSPLHSRFWTEHPEYWRYPNRFRMWNDRCLNYGLQPVRDHAMALIRELCDRYDFDGLELDWNRFPLHFREGEEIAKGRELTKWMVDVRGVVLAAEKRWNHRILLVPRVPARPDVSIGTGLDAVAWAKDGLIDHLIVSPFWATTDFDIPIEQWTERLKGTGVGVTAGLEIRVQPHKSSPTIANTPERRRGAAMAALGRGSQGIYLFNCFDIAEKMPHLLGELHSVESLAHKDRSYVVTFADISIPNKPIPAALPKKLAPGESAEFKLFIGPKPLDSVRGEVKLTLAPSKPQDKCEAKVALNRNASAKGDGHCFGSEAFCEGYNTITVSNIGGGPLTVNGVELVLRFPQKPTKGPAAANFDCARTTN